MRPEKLVLRGPDNIGNDGIGENCGGNDLLWPVSSLACKVFEKIHSQREYLPQIIKRKVEGSGR